MATKFHVNPETGVPGECTASAGRCPFGGVAVHGDSRGEAIEKFEKTFVALPPAKVKVDEPQLLTDYQDAVAQQAAAFKALRDGRASGLDADARQKLAAKHTLAADEAQVRLRALEDAGLGHTIPDDGPTLRVATREQKILLEDELMGQISDGQWENTEPHDHWEVWSSAKVIVDPKNVGRNFNAVKDNYQLNAKSLLDVVGDRMVESVQIGTNNPGYDEGRMGQDLKDLRKIFKAPRADHKGSAPAAPSAGGSATMGATDFATAINGPGLKRTATTYMGRNIGHTDPRDHSGSTVVIAAKADGTRARMMVKVGDAFASPSDFMGQPFTHLKRTSGGVSDTPDLHIVGIINPQGAVTGWVPTKRTQTFTLEGI